MHFLDVNFLAIAVGAVSAWIFGAAYYGALGKTSPSPQVSTIGWDQVIKCTEQDRYTAVVDFKSQYGPYLALGSGVDGILPAAVLDPVLAARGNLASTPSSLDLTRGSGNPAAFKGTASLSTVLDGTGPFVMSSNARGTQVVLVRNPNYWDQAGRAHLDKIIFRIEPDLATEEKDVRSGAVQVGLNLGLAVLASLSAAVRAHTVPLTVDPVLGSGAEVLMFNLCATDGGLWRLEATGVWTDLTGNLNVGLMTVAMLMKNTLLATTRQLSAP